MHPSRPLIGREEEQAVLDRAIEDVRRGSGGLLLVTGEAGVGTTALVEAVRDRRGLLALVGTPSYARSEPYGPIVAVFRAYLRVVPDGLNGTGPLSAHLNAVLPELGPPPDRSDPPTLIEAIRWGFEQIAVRQPALAFLDDLHRADEATIDLLAAALGWLESLPMLVVGAYRSDDLSRDHPLRRLRLGLRQASRSRELVLAPLDQAGTAALAALVLRSNLSPAPAATLQDRTHGLPFFVEELAAALRESGRLRATPSGLALDPSDALPIPESVRDAVLLRAYGLSAPARTALEVATVAGLRFQLSLVTDLVGGDAGLDELIEREILVEAAPGSAPFDMRSCVRRPTATSPGGAGGRSTGRSPSDSKRARPRPASSPSTGTPPTSRSERGGRSFSPSKPPSPSTPTAMPPAPPTERSCSGLRTLIQSG